MIDVFDLFARLFSYLAVFLFAYLTGERGRDSEYTCISMTQEFPLGTFFILRGPAWPQRRVKYAKTSLHACFFKKLDMLRELFIKASPKGYPLVLRLKSLSSIARVNL